MNNLLFTLGLLFLLTGCNVLSTSDQAMSVIARAAQLNYEYETGEAFAFVDNTKLTEAEVSTILTAVVRVDRTKARLKEFTTNPADLVDGLPDVTAGYIRIKASYLQIREIVIRHQAEYTDAEWRTFVMFDAGASRLDEEFSELVAEANSNAALLSAIRLADSVVKIAAIL